MSLTHRIRQGSRALLAFAYDVDYDLVARYLNGELLLLFRQMGRSEQLHSLNVLRVVLAKADNTAHDLAVAALLHDAGKSRYKLAVWQKTVAVLVEKLLPALNDRLNATETLSFWRAPFVVRRWHPKWSAELLAAAHVSERAVWLVLHHQDNPENWRDHPHYDLLLRLQVADEIN